MVTQSHARNATVFGAIADPIRRGILDALKQGQMPAGELARRFPVSRPAVSRHLRILKDAGLVRESRQSQMRIYSLRPEPLAEMDNWLANYRLFWAARLHDLKRFVESQDTASTAQVENEEGER
jgi:DNA-binding transcriptional ArsR family regulator